MIQNQTVRKDSKLYIHNYNTSDMRLIPLSEEAKKEINFIQNLRKEEMAIHHNYSKADTTYQACEDLYFRNKQEVFVANNQDMFVGLMVLGFVFLAVKIILRLVKTF